MTLTCGPPPGPAPTMMSVRLSPLKSPAARVTPPRKLAGEGEEAGQQGAVGDLAVGLDLVQFGAVDDLDVRAAAGAGADDDVGAAVAVDVVGGDGDAAAEAGVEGEEAGQQAVVAAVEHLDVRRCRRARRRRSRPARRCR